MQISLITPVEYPLYASIPNYFRVEALLQVQPVRGGLGGLSLLETPVSEPFIRDYSATGQDHPAAWAAQYDLRRWGIFLAWEDAQPVGGAAVALDSPVFPARDLQRRDLAVLWDIRVAPDWRGRGIGRALFRWAVAWAREQGCGQLGIETDSSNVPACKFYQRQGCALGAILRHGYSGVPDVAAYAMLLWYLDL